MPTWLSAHEVIDRAVDDGTFVAWDDDVVSTDPLAFVDTRPYADRLADAADRAGTTEAVVTGAARIGGRTAAVVVGEFGFMAGTQGMAVGERVARALERAAVRGWPVVGMPASGGTRMQEGSLAFVQMLTIASVVARYRAAGQRLVTWLRHPTTGGVLASWGSLGQLVWAQPGALIALTGPRVVELTGDGPRDDASVRAEHLRDAGAVDDVVAADDLRRHLRRALDGMGDAAADPTVTVAAGGPATSEPAPAGDDVDVWASVARTRNPDRPGVRALVAAMDDVVHLGGVAAGGRDAGCVAALSRIGDTRVVLVAHDRPPGGRGARLGAAGYRTARRAMRLAAELSLPLVTVVDTQGASTTAADEAGGLAGEIAHAMATMARLAVPTVAVLLGEGSGGGAIAWLAADRVLAAEHAWLAPIAPEGASAILFRSPDRAADVARRQAIDVRSLQWIGLVDRIVDEHGPWVATLRDAVVDELGALSAQAVDERLRARHRRLRTLARRGPAGPR